MSSWFSSSAASVNIDEKIAQATSESIPLGDIDFAVALEIADLIRSKQVLPKDAMRSLKKRFMSKKENPNTQKSCLKLIDFCIKNGGEHFVIEISSKEFLDPFVVLLHETNLNETVKVYILELIQSWSIMFSTNPKLTYVNQIYTKLQKESFKFPQINSEIDSTLIESKVAPEWEDSDACMLCSTLFTFLNRKHHCRSCGGVFCGLHSSKSCELPELGINIPVRVCDSCFDEHKQKLDKIKASKKKNSKKHSHSHSRKVSFDKSSSTAIDEIDGDMDEDLKKAIELSLKESGVQVSKPRIPSISDTLSKHEDGDYDEDADMKAAIAASLSDFKQTPTSTDAQPQQQEQEQEHPQKETSQYQEPSLYSNLLPQSNKSSNEIPYSVQPQKQQQLQQQNHIQPSEIQSNPNALTAIEEQNIYH
ncbi:unnamed protein product [[Candida] boidinii]|uniref:Vacuolar protein sorting-associated protein 27 n=1 Tax=Candida boidinii TaxID=5477 RepID=A0A9W6WJ87_CANBO|nr:unnamed protein product [[Candida] boidinii]